MRLALRPGPVNASEVPCHDRYGAVLFLALGTAGIGLATVVTLGSVLFFGFLLLAGGGAQLLQLFKCRGWRAVLLQGLIGLLYVFAGVEVINNPIGASVLLTLLLGATLGAIGLMRLFVALSHRGTPGWVWTAFGGVVTLLLSAMILIQWPVSGLWVIGLLVSIEMVVNGWSLVLLALAARRSAPA